MYFKRLEIFGFKSFADRLKIEFEPGITSIVGPNGCGKTNIVDAIKWVMGETSTRELRGKRMEDVIFNGSNLRKALGMAEVSLTLDNSKNILPVDYREVNIMRRLFRSGESEYYINKNLCRLKDISELFMDTGLGVNSYSLIEQGNVEFIINAKPEERRFIFEEAAGVTKYKARKEEALRKLEKTEQNLTRLQDIMGEVKRQISSLDYQARKAHKFQKQKEELKRLEVGLLMRNLKNFKEHLTEEEEKQQISSKEIQGINSQMLKKEANIVSLRVELTNKEKEIVKLQDEIFKKSSRIIHLEDTIQLHKNRQEELQSRKESVSEEIKEDTLELKNLYEMLKKTEEDFNLYQERISDEERKGNDEEEKLKEIERRLKHADKNFKEGKEEIINLLTQKSHLKNEISTKKIYLENFKIRKEKLLADKIKKEEQKKTIDQEQAKIKQLLEEKESALKLSVEEREKIVSDDNGKYVTLKKWETLIVTLKEAVINLQKKLPEYNTDKIEGKLKEISVLMGEVVNISKQIEEIVLLRHDKLPKIDEEKIFLAGLIKDKEQKEIDKKLVLEELETISNETENLDKEILQKQDIIQKLEQNFKEYEKNEEMMKESIKLTEEELEKEKIIYADLQKEVIFLKTQISRNREKLDNLKKDRERLELEKNKLEERLKNKRNEFDNFDKGKEDLKRNKIVGNEDIEQLYKEKDALETELKNIQTEKLGIAENLRQEEENLRTLRGELNKTQGQLHQIELQLMRVQVEIEGVENELKTDYLLNIEEATNYSQGLEISESNIENLKKKLDSLGVVNLAAPEEYTRLQERWNFLNTQQEDLLKAKEDLRQVISKVDVTTKANFEGIFAKVRANFKEVSKSLFEGGEADLILTNESNILESGIDIIIQPPGKKLQNISLLSGGEKALTAIALLFAFYMVKPSPFCVLDEIDASLDDANLIRFTRLLKDFTSQTQFIIITHNKKTMEMSDILYGVTMEEFGISKLISVKFHREEKLNATSIATY